MKIFISSVQKEFTAERKALAEYLSNDPLLRRFFEPFLFERDVPASDRRPDEVYLDEVRDCDIYIGLFGDDYGRENQAGLSSTHLEYEEATRLGKSRLIFVKGETDDAKHPKMRALIRGVADNLVRRRFNSPEELIASVYASLVRILEERELIRVGPFDASFCRNASLDDLDETKITRFLGLARRGRHFPLPADTPAHEVLAHLNLLDKGRPTNAAILLFGKQPQRFLITSEVKCAHFHGREVAKPIPSYQVYKGTVFDLVDQAKDFVLSKIDLWVGTREESTRVPTKYEIPQEVVAEAIVNAVVHRDYTSNASVQVMLFKDRLEIWNPGSLPPPLTPETLRGPHASVPHNPLLAEPMYLTKYIERMGTGIRDMIRRCKNAGLPEPEIRMDAGSFVLTIRRKGSATKGEVRPSSDPVTDPVTDPATDPVVRIVLALALGEMAPSAMWERLGLKHRPTFRENYLRPALGQGLIEPTIPNKPNSPLQKYRLTEKGRRLLEELHSAGGKP
jgi:predicted HTH transcriptional regulator